MPSRRAARGFALAFVLLLALPSAPGAEAQNWEGNAAVVRKGEFGSPGLFAASDSFPKNTVIQVENPQNSKTVQVTVVERINGSGNVFLLLSEEAAAALGLSSSEVIRVKARVLVAAGGRSGAQDLTRSQDSDVNPAAALEGLLEPEGATAEAADETAAEPSAAEAPPAEAAPEEVERPEALAAETAAEEPAAPQSPAAAEAAAEPAETAAAAPPATEPAPAPTAASEAPALSAEERRLEELASRIPQKRLFLPPRDSEAFALQEEAPEEPAPIASAAETPPAAEAPAGEAPAEEAPVVPVEQPVEQEALVAEPAPLPAEAAEELPLAEAAVEEPPAEGAPAFEEPPALSLGAPREDGAAETQELAAPAPSAPEAEVPAEATAALPAAETLPPAAPAPTPVAEEPAAPAAVAAVPTAPGPSVLERRSFYLQLGAYSTRSLAEKLAREVSSYAHFSVAVLPSVAGSRQLYKVLIGPLNRDESGTLLFQFRARGFKDAFVQFVE